MCSRKCSMTMFGRVVCILIFSGSTGLTAQESSPYKSFDVMILPEYEHPGVEIRVKGEVQPGQYPRYLEMEVPPNTPVALVSRSGPQGEPVSERIATRTADGKTYLPIDVSEAWFFVRYFFNPFESEGGARTFTYHLSTNEVLPEFHIIILQPVAAQNFQHSLAEADEQVDEFGLLYYRQHLHGLQPGTGYPVTVSYENPSNVLTVAELQARMEQLQAGGEAGRPAIGSQPSNLTTVLLTVILLAVGIFIIKSVWGSRRAMAEATSAQKARGGAALVKKGPRMGTGKGRFCASCGSLRRPGARFCFNCGKEF
ncbi:MAG: hypothetical protein ACETWG_04150 [Candidatus Neomarinimicrobiota bacterium]